VLLEEVVVAHPDFSIHVPINQCSPLNGHGFLDGDVVPVNSLRLKVNRTDLEYLHGASRGWSLLIDFAAHADMASRVQPPEQTTCQRGVREVIEGRRLGADEGPVIPLMWRTPVLAKPLVIGMEAALKPKKKQPWDPTRDAGRVGSPRFVSPVRVALHSVQ
jgi:hypothetical protein